MSGHLVIGEVTELTRAEMITLAECEESIERGMMVFLEVGSRLATIRDQRLYRGGHETFEAYCRQRWGFNRHRASQLISAVDVVTKVTSAGLPAPTNERQARELGKVPEPERAEVWQETVERTNGKPTAAVVREVARERTETPEPAGPSTASPAGSGTTPGAAAASPAAAPEQPAVAPEPVTPAPAVEPPPGSPATWGPEQVEANRLEVERKRMIEAARRHARTIVTTIRAEISTVTAGVELGEHGLVTAQMVADIRESVEFLARFVEAPA